MSNLVIELLLLIVVLVNCGAIVKAKIYSQLIKEIQYNKSFCSESIYNLYCIVWEINSKLITPKLVFKY